MGIVVWYGDIVSLSLSQTDLRIFAFTLFLSVYHGK